MKKFSILALALGLTLGLFAYGVSPSQYNAGRAQDGQAPGTIPMAPQPQPVPGGALMPGQGGPVMATQPTPVQDYDAIAIPEWAKAWKHYKWEEAKEHWDKKDALFCDARAKSEYDQGHIPGAIPLPVGEFDKYYEMYKGKLKKAKNLITYCHGVGCQLSNKVAQKLYNEKKLTNVGSFFGGWPQWQQHNMPVETGPGPGGKEPAK